VGIPQFIKELHPDIKLKQYDLLKSNQEFLLKVVKTCEECYLIATEYHGRNAVYEKRARKITLNIGSSSNKQNHFNISLVFQFFKSH